MIDYDAGIWGFTLIFQLSGSIAKKAMCIAAPCSMLAIAMHLAVHKYFENELAEIRIRDSGGISIGIGGYLSVLGFLLVFRTQQAYFRWWEGSTLLQTTRGEWFNAYSNLIAFCTCDPARQEEVESFQHLLVRLVSLLHGSALEMLSPVDGCPFEVVDTSGMDKQHLRFLAGKENRVNVVLQWVQKLVVEKCRDGTLDIAAPILSRVFQEFSHGIVNISNARKLQEFPFPFPYAQLLVQGLAIQWIVTPALVCLLCEDSWWAGVLAFTTTFLSWSILYVAMEIEEPFGDDANDLPLQQMQMNFNTNLMELLEPLAQVPPKFTFDASKHRALYVAQFSSRVGAHRMSFTDTEATDATVDTDDGRRTSNTSFSAFAAAFSQVSTASTKSDCRKRKRRGYAGLSGVSGVSGASGSSDSLDSGGSSQPASFYNSTVVEALSSAQPGSAQPGSWQRVSNNSCASGASAPATDYGRSAHLSERSEVHFEEPPSERANETPRAGEHKARRGKQLARLVL